MSQHIITVAVDDDYLQRLAKIRPVTDDDREDSFFLSIECTVEGGCGGWIECDGDHAGFDPDDEDSPAFDQWEDVVIHGVPHEWRWGYNWTVPYVGCVVRSGDWERPDDIPMDRPGRYLVEDEWDDYTVTLELVREIAGPGSES